ncbi:MAG: hypothetical protein RL199_1249 [Pseudomonadota bacterium]
MNHKPLPWMAAGSMALAACVQPSAAPTPATLPDEAKTPAFSAASAALIANTNVAGHLDDLALALYAMKDAKLLDGLFPPAEPPVEGIAPGDCPEGAVCDELNPLAGDEPLDMRSGAKDIEKWLAEKVFVEANVDATAPEADAAHVVFKLQPQAVCPRNVDESGAEVVDAGCAKALAGQPVRFVTSSPSEHDLDLQVLVGARHPADLALHDEAVSLELDVGVAKASLLALAEASGAEKPDLPAVTGKVRATVTREGVQKYALDVSVVEPLHLSYGSPVNHDDVDATVSAKENLLHVGLDGLGKTVSATLDLGPVDVKAALNLLFARGPTTDCTPNVDPELPPDCVETPAAPRTGTLGFHLGGLQVGGLLDGTTDAATFTGVGLGGETSRVTFGEATLLALDVNADAGRHLDVTLAPTDAGLTVAVTPKLSVRLDHTLTPVADQFPDELGEDSWLREGFLSLLVDGETPKVLFPKAAEAPPCDETGCPEAPETPYAKVMSGSVTLAAQGIESIVAHAPMCIVDRNPAPETGKHPLEFIAAAVCE